MSSTETRSESIRIREEFEVDYWTPRLGIPKAELLQVVRQVGGSIHDVLSFLSRRAQPSMPR